MTILQEPKVDINNRQSLIEWLAWNDPNGCYTDEDSAREGLQPMTLSEARDIYLEHSREG